jgi:hypothetical protein
MKDPTPVYAALSATRLYKMIYLDSGAPAIQEYVIDTWTIRHIDAVWALCARHRVTHCFLLPELAHLTNPQFLEVEESDFGLFVAWEDEDTKEVPVFARITRRQWAGSSVMVGFPPYSRFGTWKVESPSDLLGTLHYLSTAFSTPIQWGLGHIAMNIIMAKNATRGKWLHNLTIDTSQIPFMEAADVIRWKIPQLSPKLLSQNLIVVQEDRNSDYLAACTRVKLGEGNPVHVPGGWIDDSKPGIYRIHYNIGDSIFNDIELPNVFWEDAEWVTDDLIRQARQVGYTVNPLEAWQWERGHRTLENFATFMWENRDDFHPERGDNERYSNLVCRANAYNTTKGIALLATGRFAFERNKILREDFWCKVVGMARATNLYHINKYAELGYKPICVHHDSVFYVLDPQQYTSVPGILDRYDKLGGYKHVCTILLDRDFLEFFNQAQSSAAINNYCKKRANAAKEINPCLNIS